MMSFFATLRPRPLLAGLLLAGFFAPPGARAQLTSDQVPRGRTISTEDQVKSDIERSRFRLGPVRILPSLEISQAGYDNNVFGTAQEDAAEPIGDWSATVAAGIGWIVPVGSKLYLRGNVLPEYTWYNKLAARRNFGGTYGGALLAFFNRLSLQVSGFSGERLALLNTETEARVIDQREGGSARVEVDLTRALALFAGAEVQRIDFRTAGDAPISSFDVEEFDREESLARGGLRFRLSPDSDVSLSVEGTQTEFVTVSERDNRTEAVLLGIHYARPRFYLNLVGGYRRGRSYNDSLFPEYSTPSGSFFASMFVRRDVELRLYGGRRVVYGGFPQNTFYLETLGGVGLEVQALKILLLRGYGEYGTNDYDLPVLVGDTLVDRRDPIRTLGGGFSLLLFRQAVLTATAYETQHRSNIPGLTRTVFRFETAVSLRGDFAR